MLEDNSAGIPRSLICGLALACLASSAVCWHARLALAPNLRREAARFGLASLAGASAFSRSMVLVWLPEYRPPVNVLAYGALALSMALLLLWTVRTAWWIGSRVPMARVAALAVPAVLVLILFNSAADLAATAFYGAVLLIVSTAGAMALRARKAQP